MNKKSIKWLMCCTKLWKSGHFSKTFQWKQCNTNVFAFGPCKIQNK